MKLEGSCACHQVKFHLESHTPYPFNVCYCSICRKTGGSSGTGINIMGEYNSLKVSQGEDLIKIFRAPIKSTDNTVSPSHLQRHFCGECGSHLWTYSEQWKEWVYPYASSIDTDLPEPPHLLHFMVDSKASWVTVLKKNESQDRVLSGYPDIGIADWHDKFGLTVD